MRRAVWFLVLLLAGLGVLALAGYFVLAETTGAWFERDLDMRAHLAVSSGKRSIVLRWGDRERLTAVLEDITHDERILGAAACSATGDPLAQTTKFPIDLSMKAILGSAEHDGVDSTKPWRMIRDLEHGRVHIHVNPIRDESDAKSRGYVILVHDLTYLARREATTRNLLLIAFFVLSIGAALITMIAARLAWRRWTDDLRTALSGGPAGGFKPLVRDVRSLVARLVSERRSEASAGTWNPARLRATLRQHLHGERVVVLANREPYIHERIKNVVHVQHPASGLVTALEPVMRACSGTWVAHGSGGADREFVDDKDRLRVPPGEESYTVRRVWLSEAEENGYYYGFANEGLWPLCHLAHTRPVFRVEDWEHYVQVNRKFAKAVTEEVDSDDPIVLVQDYHFALAPRMIRERLPRATILTFWHIPWPNAEVVGICPFREELISGLLGSSILGFHTKQHCNNFIDSVDAYVESRIDRETEAIVQGARRTLVRPYPISIDWPVRWLEGMPSVAECRAAVRKELELPEDALLGVGVDRLDYTKGIEERLLAVDQLLARWPEYRGRFSFVQLAAPSRTKIRQYRELDERVAALEQSINERWGTPAWRPIRLLRTHHEPPAVYRQYRAADFCFVSSLHDGMNLVAKEFVAARDDERGVLILSQFTGAARDLTEALVVNPYDLQQASEAMATALQMPVAEQTERMRSMRRLVAEFNVYRWAGRMLIEAAELRRRERLSGRLMSVFRSPAASS